MKSSFGGLKTQRMKFDLMCAENMKYNDGKQRNWIQVEYDREEICEEIPS